MQISRYCFLSNQRLRKKSDVDRVFSQGRRVYSSCYQAVYLKNDLSYPRLAIIVAKKKCPLSVGRNHFRRLVREHFRLNQHQLGGVDLVVLLKSPVENPKHLKFLCLEKLFKKLLVASLGSH